MQNYFYELADYTHKQLKKEEVAISRFSGEDSLFSRFTKNKIRQVGNVKQNEFNLQLINGKRHATYITMISGVLSEDRARVDSGLDKLRNQIKELKEDPHLYYSTAVNSSEAKGTNKLIDPADAINNIVETSMGIDLVGIYASGGLFRGFANSLGQKNWYESYSFNFDFSAYLEKDKAAKHAFAGFSWNKDEFAKIIGLAKVELETLGKSPKTIEPGVYRAYLAPDALSEIMSMLCWGGFGLKAKNTKQTPLLKMIEEGKTLKNEVCISENIEEGIGPNFDQAGFIKPNHVSLIKKGQVDQFLISARSAKEYDVAPNGANHGETPTSLDMKGGEIQRDEILKKLDTGIYINNLWYLNFSDRAACRLTGMTRFASFWVEKGKIVAPLNVMRFDDSVYRILGTNLMGLTRERDLLISSSTYNGRATDSMRLPGALVDGFALTL